MALEELLTAAARITWRRRSWWLLGLLATSGGLLVTLFLRGVAWWSAGQLSLGSLNLQGEPAQIVNPGALIGGVTGAFVLGLVLWLVSAVAEGGLIVAVRDRTGDEAPTVAASLRSGLGLLGRFIGIDTLLFLPLFILSLALMVVGFTGLAGLVLAATRPGAQLTDLLLVAGATTVFSIPLLLLTLLIGAIVIVLRTLAFRGAAMEGLNAADSIRRAWKLLRSRLFSITALALVLWAIRSLIGTPLRLLTMIMAGLGWAIALTGTGSNDGGFSLLLALGGLILAFLNWLVNGVMNVYGSTSWTLAYESWMADPVER